MTSTFIERSDKLVSPFIGRFHPIEIDHAKGCYLFDKSGKAYLDFSAGIAVASTGHCHPEVVKAISEQAATLIHACIGVGYYDAPITLTEKLNSILPNGPYASFFCQSGSEANEAALKLVRYTSKKSKVIAFEGGFHGRTYGSLSLTTSKRKYREGYENLPGDVDFFPYPYAYRCPWNKKDYAESVAESVRQLKESSLFSNDVAAVFIEPVLGEAGYAPCPPEFLRTLAEVCKANNILLVCDEIQTGIGRTGKWFSFEHAGIDPDVITLAKGLASGMPLGACLAKKDLMNQWPSGAHGGTYGGNPVTCQAANASINVMSNYVSEVDRLGKLTLNFLNEKLSGHKNVGDIRGQGLMIGIDLVIDKESKTPNTELTQKVLKECFEKELILITCGDGNVVRICPPLIIDEKTLLKGLLILVDVLNAA
ncbi:aspartate aminotransferase family protein [Candidatus Marinamargulisbacteria bacterium SCGC AAA071-K20]|nr:aspartate aminotransferase family protein [Candidatus Marinamargulisbacteria bacterium SCGC AAA071-K20]